MVTVFIKLLTITSTSHHYYPPKMCYDRCRCEPEAQTIAQEYGADVSRQRKEDQVSAEFASGWMAKLDQRTTLAQDMQARFDEVCADLGGADRLSYMQRSLVERGLWLEYWLGQAERDLASGASGFDVGKWVQASLPTTWRTMLAT